MNTPEMRDDMQPAPQTPAHFSFDADKFSRLFDNVRGSSNDYLALISSSFEKASDVNKQLFAFHERILLIDLGIIGLSVTALTSVASKMALLGWRRYLATVVVGIAWYGLLMSVFLCRSVMHDYLTANHKLYKEWMMTVFDLSISNLATDIQRFSIAISGPLEIDGEIVDSKMRFINIAEELRAKFSEAKYEHIQKTLQSAGAEAQDTMSTGTASRHAMRYMQVSLMLLGAIALFLITSLK